MSKGIIFFSIFLLAVVSHEAKVITVNGTSVTFEIELEDQIKPQEKYYLIDGNNNKVGIISVQQVTESNGTAQLLKGAARPGYALMRYVAANTATGKKKTSSYLKSKMGFLADLMSNSMSLKFGSTSVELKGESFAFSFAYQMSMSKDLKALFLAGYRSFNVTLANTGCTSGKCTLTVNYISLGGKLDYYLADSFSVGAGLEYLSPSSKTSTFLTEDQIQSNSVASLSLGFLITPQFPISLSYNSFLENKNATASYIALQTGFLWSF
jgi:hypothetical protein